MRIPVDRRVALWTTTVVLCCCGADWPQFRGADSNSVARDRQPPAEWGPGELAWQADLPGRGVSSPIVVDRRVIVTCSSGVKQDRLHVACFDAASGARRWERQFWATGRTLTHPTSANAAPTPASDGRLVFAFFSSNDMACLDLDGNLQWYRGLAHDYPAAANDTGMSSSPVVVGGVVVAQIECQGESFAAGIDPATGETRWRVPRPHEASWASPAVMRRGQDSPDLVLLQSPSQLTAHDPATGRQVWQYKAACDGISSAAARDGVVYLASKGMTALRPTSDQPEVLWNSPQLLPGAASVVVDDRRLLAVNRAGVLLCADASDGRILWRTRLEGEYWGTPALVGNRLYAINQKGVAKVVEISEDGSQGKVVGQGQLPGDVLASPAVSDGALYARSDKHLWKIAAP